MILWAASGQCQTASSTQNALSSTASRTQEFLDDFYESKTERISEEYKSGMYMIYDCLERHFACVNEDGFVKCREKREFSKKKRRPFLDCAPLKKFATTPECLKKYYNLIHTPTDKAFCFRQADPVGKTATATPNNAKR